MKLRKTFRALRFGIENSKKGRTKLWHKLILVLKKCRSFGRSKSFWVFRIR